MNIVVWLVEGTWEACVDAARGYPGADVTLLHVVDPAVAEGLHGAYAGLVGRAGHGADPGSLVESATDSAERELFDAAETRLAGPARRSGRRGRIEREAVAAAIGADLLVVARDGDRSRPGPRSLAPPTRFVVDHAPCPVLLLWPGTPPDPATIPPPPR